MRRLARALPAALLAAACTAPLPDKERAWMGGRFAEMQRIGEAEAPDLAAAGTAKLYYLCLAYTKLKRYDKLFPCLDQLERNVAGGDRNIKDWDAYEKKAGAGGAAAVKLGMLMNLATTEIDATPTLHLMRAEAMIDLGRYEAAVEEGEKASLWRAPFGMEIAERTFRYYALGYIGVAHALKGERDKAIEAAARMESISECWPPAFPIPCQGTEKYTGLAKIHVALGNFETALDIIRRRDFDAGGLFGGLGASGGEAFWWGWLQLPKQFLLNKCLFETGRVGEARKGYEGLLKVPQAKDNGEIHWLILYDLGRIAMREGRPGDGIDFFARAIDVIERQRATINTEASKIGFVGSKQGVYRDLIAALFAEGRHAAAFEYAERAKARALVDMLAAKKDFAVPAGNVEQARALVDMAEAAEAEARVQLDERADASRSREVAARAKESLRAQAPELASLVSVTHLRADEIRSRLAGDEVLVEYYYEGAEAFAFVVAAEGLQAVKLDGRDLAAEVREFREALEDVGSDRHLAVSGRLYRRLVQPLEPLLSRPNLLVVPHGALHYLPFNALHDGRRHLIERHRFRLLPSASVLAYLGERRPAKPAGMLAFGNPDLGDPRYDLVHAQAEALAVSAAVPRSRALLRRQATETAFKRLGPGFAYLHLASHGEFDPDRPLRSRLLFAKDEENDGSLTLGELYSLRLDADLVTLSACETGLGKISNGDDVVGLTRGFLYAGSGSVVASLWKVDDLATAHLMTRFYAHLADGDKREALRAAQLETKGAYPHPFYWAAFQLTGNAR
jgi:CHAT domain-containing protein